MITLRKLTFKSKIGFGKYENRTVQNLIDNRKHSKLIAMYYNYEKISFVDEVLKELRITEEYQINKPGVDKDMKEKYIENDYYFFKVDKSWGGEINKLKKEKKYTRGYLQSKNHSR